MWLCGIAGKTGHYLSGCFVVLLIARSLNCVSAIFHSSLFTFHFSLKMKSHCVSRVTG